MAIWVGIDVSMETLDCAWISEGSKFHIKVPNSEKGFRQLIGDAPGDARFAMEATGSYYVNVALFLHQQGCFVTVINPRRINAHLKTDLRRNKSDKADSLAIARFASEKTDLECWDALRPEIAELQQLRAIDDGLVKQISAWRNRIHAMTSSVLVAESAMNSARRLKRYLEIERDTVLNRMETLAREIFPREMEIMESVPGIGAQTAANLIATVQDFRRFADGRKLASYLGISPTTKQSGTSVKSKGHMSKMGGKRTRRVLHMCARSAMLHNAQCRKYWERMKEKGKPGSVVMIAIMNKLVRQMHAMILSDKLYDPTLA